MFKKQEPKRIVLVIFIILFLSLILTPSVQAGSIFIFNKNLQIGSSNPDVKEMQKFLNNNGFALSNSGVGSSG